MGGLWAPYTDASAAGGLLADFGLALLSLASDVIDVVPLLLDRRERAETDHEGVQLVSDDSL